MNLTAILIVVVLWGASLAGSYLQGRHDGADGELATQAREDDVAQKATDAAASAAATAISQIKVQRTTIQNEVQHEVSERVVYRDPACSHTAEQLQRLNAAITGERPEPAGRGFVPPADALVGRELRGDDDKARRGGGSVP